MCAEVTGAETRRCCDKTVVRPFVSSSIWWFCQSLLMKPKMFLQYSLDYGPGFMRNCQFLTPNRSV